MAERRKVFEELGFLDEAPEEQNPYEVLGLDRTFVQGLLQEEPSGSAVQIVTGGMYRILSRRYHTDVEHTGDSDRFRKIEAARSQIEAATPTKLKRWSNPEQVVASSFRLDKLREESQTQIDKAVRLVQLDMEFGHDPQHFSQLRWSQGVLLHHNRSTLLLRTERHGVQILRGERPNDSQSLSAASPAAANFHNFMRTNRFFGLEPSTRIATYLDGTGRASILQSDLSFIMDISQPVAMHRSRKLKKSEDGSATIWSKAPHPVLLTTHIPEDTSRRSSTPDTQMITFAERNPQSARWNLRMDVSGSTADPNFFKRIRHRGAIGATALSGTGSRQMNYFNVMATTIHAMLEQDAGYSPLMTPGNSLVFYDPQNQIPVVTDARIMGMLGNGAQTS